MPLWAYLVSQEVSQLTGATGAWVGTGLLGGILSWLLFVHLPAKDKQLKELLDSHNQANKEARTDFKAALNDVLQHCVEEMDKTVRILGEPAKFMERTAANAAFLIEKNRQHGTRQ